jgi:DNA invertase Pin-like site-specific DNA recombinase
MPPRSSAVAEPGNRRVPVAIYARVSTDNQVGGRFDSCESQTAVCRDYIRQRADEGWYEVASFTDAAYSGGSMNRPGIQSIKRMIEAGEVKVVVIFKLERMSRNMDEWGPFRAFLERHGCRLESATEDISESEPEGRLKNNILISVSDFERRNTAKKTRIKMRQQAMRGYWNGGMVPYGYTYDKNTQSLQKHPKDSLVIRRIFEQAAQLVSLTDIAKALNAEGLRTPERVMQRRDGTSDIWGGRMFRSDGLRLIIRNPLYRGVVKFEGQEYAAKHEGLVSQEIWDRANAATAEMKTRPVYRFQERDAQNHLLKGLAWCGSCGRALVPNDSGKKSVRGVKYRYYTCSLVMRESASRPCVVRRLSADALERVVIALVGEASKHPTLISEMVETSRRMRVGDREALRSEVDRIKGALTLVDKKLHNCAEAVANDGVDALREALIRRAADLRDERQRLLVEQERARQALVASDAGALEERRIRDNLERLGQVLPNLPPAERKELIRLFVERVDVRGVTASPRRKPQEDSVAASADAVSRIIEINIKLHLAELVRGMEERAAAQSESAASRRAISIRGLDLGARVDFSNAQRGEITITAPVRRTIRLESRVRTVPTPQPVAEHAIIRARQWKRWLDSGEVASRFALAKRTGVDPAMVTRILKLVELAPEIQDYLASLRTPSALWHFNIRTLGNLSNLPVDKQRLGFAKIRAMFDTRNPQHRIDPTTIQTPSNIKSPWRDRPRLTGG